MGKEKSKMEQNAEGNRDCLRVSKLQGVPETLLIPLLGRARARKDDPDLEFEDPWAERVLQQLDIDLQPFLRDRMGMRATAYRAKVFDQAAREFFAAHPKGRCISIGAGFDTRFHRIDNGRLTWVDFDLPQVIDLKSQWLPESDRYQMVKGSILDPKWPAKVQPEAMVPTLFIVEGLFVYLKPRAVRQVLFQMARFFPADCELIFDCPHRVMRHLDWLVPSVMATSARFRFGSLFPHRLCRIHPRLRYKGSISLLDGIGGFVLLGARLFRRLSANQDFYRMVHFHMVSAQPLGNAENGSRRH